MLLSFFLSRSLSAINFYVAFLWYLIMFSGSLESLWCLVYRCVHRLFLKSTNTVKFTVFSSLPIINDENCKPSQQQRWLFFDFAHRRWDATFRNPSLSRPWLTYASSIQDNYIGVSPKLSRSSTDEPIECRKKHLSSVISHDHRQSGRAVSSTWRWRWLRGSV